MCEQISLSSGIQDFLTVMPKLNIEHILVNSKYKG